MEAISLAKVNDFEGARNNLKLAGDELTSAHHIQTELIQGEVRGEKVEISLLMVHAQDHLMNAMSIKDLSEEFIDMYEKIGKVLSK